jgi:hypothetical protein
MTFESSSLVLGILTLMDFMDSSQQRMRKYNKDQSQAKVRITFK